MNDYQKRIFRRCQEVTAVLAASANPATPVHIIALIGGLAREEAVMLDIESEVLDGAGDYSLGYLLSEKAKAAAYKRALLDEYVPCWNDSTEHPEKYPGRHQWQQHPDSTPQQRERGWRRYICGMCHRTAEEDSSG